MAYAALVSVLQTLRPLLHYSDQDHQFPFQYPNPQIESLHHSLCSLQQSLENIYPVRKNIRSSVTDLEIRIRDTMYNAQDTIESFISNQNLAPKSEENIIGELEDSASVNNFLQHLQTIKTNLDQITKEAAEKAAEIKLSFKGSTGARRAGDHSGSSENALSNKSTHTRKVEIVGQENDLKTVMDRLITEAPKELQVIPITGMPGIGKTTLAKSIYEDPRTKDHFDARAWVTVSQEYDVRDIFSNLLRTIADRGQKSDISGSANIPGDEDGEKNDLSDSLYRRLFETKYLIVIDDMWEREVWDQVKRYFPDDKKGSRILLTTRIVEVADHANSSKSHHKMSLLDKDNSWKLLCQNAFLGGFCPRYLETAGMVIAENCKGLPLSLTVVGGLLFKGEKTPDYWKIIAEDTNSVAESGDQSYKEILSLSYNHLPSRLKGCFLYMGAFREDSEISVSKLIQLWVAEGLPTPPSSSDQSLEQIADRYLRDLIDRNLIAARKKTSHGQTKTCGMHDTLRDLAVDESRKEKFFHSIYRYNQEEEEGKHSQRRLSIHKNILMCLKEVYNSAKSITHPRSLLYVGPHHHHPIPYCLTFELLKVLDALTVYFSSFPTEIVKLIHLRYLSFTYNGKLPKSLSNLRNLEVLIVRRHPKIIFPGTSFLPVEIWNMPKLRHILLTETCMPDLPGAEIFAENCILLANLQTLSNVNASCFTKEVLQHIPNLKKLGVWIGAPGNLGFHLAGVLKQLEAFKFTVLNPIPDPGRISLSKHFLPETLKKLTLSGCGILWNEMTIVGQLPNLQVLKLRKFACQGPTWNPKKKEFGKLMYLLLESLELVNWEAQSFHFPRLDSLIVRHCYDLDEIPEDIGNIGCLRLIELVDCSPYAVESAKTISENKKHSNKALQVHTYSSWE